MKSEDGKCIGCGKDVSNWVSIIVDGKANIVKDRCKKCYFGED